MITAWAKAFDAELEGDVWVLPRGYFPARASVRLLLWRLPMVRVLEALDITAARLGVARPAYFYKVCWNFIHEADDAQAPA